MRRRVARPSAVETFTGTYAPRRSMKFDGSTGWLPTMMERSLMSLKDRSPKLQLQ
jgi:hypothetical protein